MTQETAFLILAFILVFLVIIMPKVIEMRIRILRWLRWNRLANWHERNMKVLVPVMRVLLSVLVVILIVLAF